MFHSSFKSFFDLPRSLREIRAAPLKSVGSVADFTSDLCDWVVAFLILVGKKEYIRNVDILSHILALVVLLSKVDQVSTIVVHNEHKREADAGGEDPEESEDTDKYFSNIFFEKIIFDFLDHVSHLLTWWAGVDVPKGFYAPIGVAIGILSFLLKFRPKSHSSLSQVELQ